MLAFGIGEPTPRASGQWLGTAAVALAAAALAGLPELLRPGYYFQDDMQSQYVPLVVELARSWLRGELPLVTDSTWSGGALAGEYQHGCFSLVHVALALILTALRLDAAQLSFALTASYVAITAGGAYRLALHYRVGAALAASVALVASLNGFNVYFSSWLPAMTGFAWVPWTWWAAARTLSGDQRARPWLAFFSYCLLVAGWHFAILMAAVCLSYLVLFEPAPFTRRSAIATLSLPLAAGGLLSAPALLCFVEYARASARSDLAVVSWDWTVPPSAIFGLILPHAVSTWSVFNTLGPMPNVVMSGGALPLLVLPAALVRLSPVERKRLLPLLALAALVLAMAATPNLSAARWPFRWLPLFHLSLALAAARALAPWSSATTDKRRLLTTPLTLAAPALLLLLAWQPSAALLLGNASLVVAGALALTWRETTPRRLPLVFASGVALNLALVPLAGPPRDITPRWDTLSCFHAAPGRGLRHLGLMTHGQIVGPRRFPNERELSPGSCFFPGNSGLLSGRPTAAGYNLLSGASLAAILEVNVHGELGVRPLERSWLQWAAPGSLLDRWGIAALLLPRAWSEGARSLVRNGWRLEATEGGVQLYLRPPEQRRAVPLLESFHPAYVARHVAEAKERLLNGDARAPVYVPDDAPSSRIAPGSTAHASLELVSTSESHVVARVAVAPGASPALVRLLRPYRPGQRASLDGAPLRLGRADGAFVVAEVPAGSRGVLRFDYQPLGVRFPGIAAFALGCVALLALTLGARARTVTSQREQKPS